MARIRSIKPEFFTSGQLVECSTNARLLFVGTWVFADDKGRHKLNYKTLKMEVFPGDPFTAGDVESMFRELWAVDLVSVYEVKGNRFFVVNGWHHQKIDRPQEPRCPSPCEGSAIPYSTNDRRTIDEHSPTDTIRSDTIRYDSRGVDAIADSSTHTHARLIAFEVSEAIKTWHEHWRSSHGCGKPDSEVRIDAMLARCMSAGWQPDKIVQAIQFGIAKNAKSWLDPDADFEQLAIERSKKSGRREPSPESERC